MIYAYFSLKPYVVTPHLNRLAETVQMSGHNVCLYAELTKIIPNEKDAYYFGPAFMQLLTAFMSLNGTFYYHYSPHIIS